jgi:uncharacterized protein
MRCPNDCDTALAPADRSGVEFDYCPTCRGVWLDRGELDKILDRELAAVATRTPRSDRHEPYPEWRREVDQDGKPKKKKRIWDVLEFD